MGSDECRGNGAMHDERMGNGDGDELGVERLGQGRLVWVRMGTNRDEWELMGSGGNRFKNLMQFNILTI